MGFEKLAAEVWNGTLGTTRRSVQILGWGKALPERVLTNDELGHMVDTSDGWIRERTGISERRIAGDEDTTASLAIQAALRALERAAFDPIDLDLIIVATITPEYLFPATACLVQDALGASRAAAFDLNAGCTGFNYALAMAAQSIQSAAYDHILVIGAETLSRIVDWGDRRTCVLFGDGAGAALLGASDAPGGVLATALGADGSGADLLILPAGGSREPATPETTANGLHYLRMDGRKVFRFATRIIPQATREVLDKADLPLEHLDLLIPHQANQRIIESSAHRLGLPSERIFTNLAHYGNTGAASVPIALCEALESGQIQAGDHVVLVGFGTGLTWGAAVIEWAQPYPAGPVPRHARLLLRLRYRWAPVRSLLRRLQRALGALLQRMPPL
jgi:3-oxoacyl-[acyl-carrier-protein] synthase-3